MKLRIPSFGRRTVRLVPALALTAALAASAISPASAQVMPCPTIWSPTGPACKVFSPDTYAASVQTQVNTLQTQIQAALSAERELKSMMSLTTFTKGQWANAQQDLLALAKVVQQNKNLSFNDENLAAAFKAAYPDFKTGVDFSKLTQTWYDNTKSAILNALQVSGLATQQFAKDDQILTQQMLDTDNATSQSQLVQTGNRIAAMTVEQLQKLQQMEAARQNVEATYYMQQSNSVKMNSSAMARWLQGSVNKQ